MNKEFLPVSRHDHHMSTDGQNIKTINLVDLLNSNGILWPGNVSIGPP